MSFKRKMRRREPKMEDRLQGATLMILEAGETLGLTADQVESIERTGEPREMADVLHARTLEIIDLFEAMGTMPVTPGFVASERAKLEARNGVGFVERVRAMGPGFVARPEEALAKKKGWGPPLLALLLALSSLLTQRTANASAAAAASSHNIHRGKLGPRRRRWYHTRGWTQSNGRSAYSAQHSTSRRGSRIGSGRGATSSPERVRRSKSCSFGGADGSASAPCPLTSHISRSSTPTAASSVRGG